MKIGVQMDIRNRQARFDKFHEPGSKRIWAGLMERPGQLNQRFVADDFLRELGQQSGHDKFALGVKEEKKKIRTTQTLSANRAAGELRDDFLRMIAQGDYITDHK